MLRVVAPDQLRLVDGTGSEHAIHPLWLRERCRDAASIDLKTQQRLQDPSDYDLNLTITAISQPTPGSYRIRFSDGHEASFDAAEILSEATLAPNSPDCPAVRLWDGSLTDLPRMRWRADPADAELAAWLEAFLTFGFVIFEGVPSVPGSVLKVATLFGFTREANFGALFDGRS